MDARERANFINSVGSTTEKKCPKCGAENVEEAMFCASCGTSLKAEEPIKEAVQEPVKEAVQEPVKKAVQEPVKEAVQEPIQETVQEPESAFAKGLPEWDMVPPQVMIRRKGMRL